MDRDALLKQVTVLGFMATDLHLYLNTHPDDKEAIAMYNQIVTQGRKARSLFEEKYGPLSYGQVAGDRWDWIDCPWPWQESFNYSYKLHEKNSECVSAPGWKEPYGEELI